MTPVPHFNNYTKDTALGKKSCKCEHGLENKNEFKKMASYNFLSV